MNMKKWLLAVGVVAAFSPSLVLAKKEMIDKNGVNLLKADKVYTSVNLHPDVAKGVLYTINYQLPVLMPRCSEVEITKLGKKKMKFRLLSSGREYVFVQHKKTKFMPLGEILSNYFTSSCSDSDLAGLSKKDKEGVKVGKPKIGMTKAGVMLAMGPPPIHVTPEPDSMLEWTYWKNKFARTVITFNEKGVVTNIR